MILALSGTDARLRSHCWRTYTKSHEVVIEPETGWVEPWCVLRRMLPNLREIRGPETVSAALERHSVAASFVLPGRRGSLDSSAALHRKKLAARLTSHMTHNEIVQDQLFEEIAGLFHDLLSPEIRVVLPNIARLDPSSLALIRTMYRLFPKSSPALVMGYEPTGSTEEDDCGILWEYSPVAVKTFVHGFHSLEGFQFLELLRVDADPPPCPDRRVDPVDPDLETRAWRSLQKLSVQPRSELPEKTGKLVLAAIDHCFEAYAFRPLLKLGLELLQRVGGLAADDEARARTMVALSAHNRQFISRGNHRLAAFLEHHYRRALELESVPLRCVCLLYRLAVTVGRRQGRIVPALALTDRGLEILAANDFPPEEAAMQEAWLRNIRAFLLMRQKRLERAFEEEQRAVALLDRCEQRSEVLRADARLSRAVVADNLAELAILIQDEDQRNCWHCATQELVGGWLDLGHLTSRMWMSFHRAGLRLDQAKIHAEAGARESRRKHVYVLEYIYLVNLADFYYRLGDPARALALYDEASPFRDLLGEEVDTRIPVEAGQIAAAVRLGELERAGEELERLIRQHSKASAGERAELEATAGWLAALGGEAEVAETRINQAIELAVESGIRDVLLRIALLAGRTCRHLGREADARSAYLRALEISQTGGPDEPVTSADLVEALHGLLSCRAGTSENLQMLVSLYPEALREDPEAWWRLGELLDVLCESAERGAKWLGDPEPASALATIRRAASQRADCRERIALMGSILPALATESDKPPKIGNAADNPPTAASVGSASAP